MRRNEPIEIVIHGPGTGVGQQELAWRVAQVHAQAVESAVEKRRCSVKGKIALLRAVEDMTAECRETETRDL